MGAAVPEEAEIEEDMEEDETLWTLPATDMASSQKTPGRKESSLFLYI